MSLPSMDTPEIAVQNAELITGDELQRQIPVETPIVLENTNLLELGQALERKEFDSQ